MNKQFVGGLAISAGLLVQVPLAKAEYIQTMGLSDRAVALAGAVVSDSRDFDAFYTNPAGAANFTGPFIGAGVRLIDTTNLKFEDSTGNNPPEDSITGSQFAYAPAAGAYMPFDLGADGKLVVGVGFGAPFAIVGVWDQDRGNHRFDALDQELFSIDLAPTVAYQLNDKLSVGASLNIQTFKFLKLQSLLNIPALGFTGQPGDTLTIQTDDDFPLPVPPWEFATSFDTLSVTLGTEFEVMPGVKLGAAWRSKTNNSYEGRAVLRQGGAVIGTAPFKVDMDLPGHLQGGASVQVMPKLLTLFADVQWTMWSDTDAFGKASLVSTPGLVAPGALPAGLNGLRLDYSAKDTVSLRLGAEYTPAELPGWAFRVGYWYDPSPFPIGTVDIITYSSDRNVFSAGVGLDQRNAKGKGFKFDVSGQLVSYADRHNDNLPGLTPGTPATYDPANGTIAFDPASGNDFNYGGYIWSLGATVSYGF